MDTFTEQERADLRAVWLAASEQSADEAFLVVAQRAVEMDRARRIETDCMSVEAQQEAERQLTSGDSAQADWTSTWGQRIFRHILALTGNVRRLAAKVTDLVVELAEVQAREKEALARVRLATAHTSEVWFYQGDGDRPESLTCPVVMSAEKLREILRGLMIAASPRPLPSVAVEADLLKVRDGLGSTTGGPSRTIFEDGLAALERLAEGARQHAGAIQASTEAATRLEEVTKLYHEQLDRADGLLAALEAEEFAQAQPKSGPPPSEEDKASRRRWADTMRQRVLLGRERIDPDAGSIPARFLELLRRTGLIFITPPTLSGLLELLTSPRGDFATRFIWGEAGPLFRTGFIAFLRGTNVPASITGFLRGMLTAAAHQP